MRYLSILLIAIIIIGSFVIVAKRRVLAPQISTSDTEETDSTGGSSGALPEKYVDAFDWPPKLQTVAGPLTCTEAGSETAQAGKTSLIRVNGREYCKTVETEGAAGSIYDQYAYAYADGSKVNIYTFTIRKVQCGNYPEPEMSECQKVENNFNPDILIDSYIRIQGSSSTSLGGIQGQVLLGPTCPVQRTPPDPNCADKSYETSLKLITAGTGETLKTFSSGTDGRFKIQVGPGQYQIIGASAQTLPRCSSQGTIVVGNGYTTTNVYCDTGIR